jgi:putative peptidoglycan lipid II flippase
MALARQGAVVGVFKAIDAGLSLLLGIAMAAVFGVGAEADALFITLFVAVVTARELGRVVRIAAVPCLVEDERKPEGQAAAISGFVLMAAVAAAAAIAAGAPLLARILAPGVDAETSALATRLLRALAPSAAFLILFGAAQASFHVRGRFYAPEIAETVWKILALALLFSAGRRYGVEAYAAGLSVAAFAQWSLLLAVGGRMAVPRVGNLRRSFKVRLLWPFLHGAAVVFCAVALRQAEDVIDRIVISFMPAGSIATFGYASRLAQLVPFVVATGFLVPFLPALARAGTRSNARGLARQAALFLATLGLPFGVMLFWCARDLVDVLLVRGQFGAESAAVAASAIRAFAVGVPAVFFLQGLKGALLVDRDIREIARVGALALAVHAAANFALKGWGVPGIAWAGTLSLWTAGAYLWFRMGSERRPVYSPVSCAAGFAGAIAVLFLPPWQAMVGHTILRVGLAGALALGAYAALTGPMVLRMQAAFSEVAGEITNERK